MNQKVICKILDKKKYSIAVGGWQQQGHATDESFFPRRNFAWNSQGRLMVTFELNLVN